MSTSQVKRWVIFKQSPSEVKTVFSKQWEKQTGKVQSLNRLTELKEQTNAKSRGNKTRWLSRQNKKKGRGSRDKTEGTTWRCVEAYIVFLTSWCKTGERVGGTRWKWREKYNKGSGRGWVSEWQRRRPEREREKEKEQVCKGVWNKWQFHTYCM